jgi:hypothetical protein
MTPLPQGMLVTSCAPCGTGKLPTPLTLTVAGGLDEAAAEAVLECEAEAVGEPDVAGLGVLIPAVHAASDSATAPVAAASAGKRYLFTVRT